MSLVANSMHGAGMFCCCCTWHIGAWCDRSRLGRRDTWHASQEHGHLEHYTFIHRSPVPTHTELISYCSTNHSHNILTLPGKTIQNIKRDNALKNWSNTSILDFLRLPWCQMKNFFVIIILYLKRYNSTWLFILLTTVLKYIFSIVAVGSFNNCPKCQQNDQLKWTKTRAEEEMGYFWIFENKWFLFRMW